MKIRSEIHLNGITRRVIFVKTDEETLDSVALKMAALTLFFTHNPTADPSPKNPAFVNYEYVPDLFSLNDVGEVNLWLECSVSVSPAKLIKIAKRAQNVRIVAIKENPQKAKQLRENLTELDGKRHHRIEVISWPAGEYAKWYSALDYANSIIGEANEMSMNLVLNGNVFALKMEKL